MRLLDQRQHIIARRRSANRRQPLRFSPNAALAITGAQSALPALAFGLPFLVYTDEPAHVGSADDYNENMAGIGNLKPEPPILLRFIITAGRFFSL